MVQGLGDSVGKLGGRHSVFFCAFMNGGGWGYSSDLLCMLEI